MARYITAREAQMTKGQHARLDRRIEKVQHNLPPMTFDVVATTEDGAYRVIRSNENSLYYVQERNGQWWQCLRKDSVLYRTFVRESAAKKFAESKATPAEML